MQKGDNNLDAKFIWQIYLKKIDIVQDIIKRMSQNCFYIKGWTLTLITAIFLADAGSMKFTYLAFGIAMCLIFWILDAYYFALEKTYRNFYCKIIHKGLYEIPILKSDTPTNWFDLKVDSSDKVKFYDLDIIFAIHIISFYLPIIIIGSIVLFLNL